LDSSINQIDGVTLMEFTWDLSKGPVTFDMAQNQTLIFASRGGSTDLNVHDYMGVVPMFNFLNPFPDPTMLKPVIYPTCGVGSYNSGIDYLGPCTCFGSFTIETNCTQSSHKFSHAFLNSDGAEILTMYWTLTESTLNADVTRIAGGNDNEWAAVGFSTPAGTMFPTDVIISPVKQQNGDYQPTAYFIPNGVRTFSGFTSSLVNYAAGSVAGTGGSVRFFNFSRALQEGNNPILNTEHVYMIAASSNAELPAQHTSRSNGADILNLVTGGVLPPEFHWTPIVTHGLLMWICWTLLIPFGFIWARFLKGYPSEKKCIMV